MCVCVCEVLTFTQYNAETLKIIGQPCNLSHCGKHLPSQD